MVIVLFKSSRRSHEKCSAAAEIVRLEAGVAAAHKGLELGGQQRLAEVVALNLVALALLQPAELVGIFHTLADHIQLQIVRQADNCLDNLGIVIADDDIIDKGFVDLQLVDRKALEIAQL